MKRRKASTSRGQGAAKAAKSALAGDSFFVESDSSDGEAKHDSESEELDEETADEKRIRLAKQYLKKLEMDKEELTSDEDAEDAVAHRLQRDVLRERGQYQQGIADRLADCKIGTPRVHRGHRLAPTCLALSPSDTKAYTGAKDATLIQWDVETGAKTFISKGARGQKKKVKGHRDEILTVAMSDDGAYLATGGRDNMIQIWDPRSLEHVHSFKGHRDTVSCLAFRKGSQQLFSGSYDRTVKVWNLEQMVYVESLFGHQADVEGIDSLFRDRALSCGLDKTVRSWKVVEETQLLFRGGHDYSMDCVSLINEDNWVTGGQDGTLSLWGANKKKPLQLLHNAHGGSWVSSVASLPFTDLLASGSSDGFVRLWKSQLEGNKKQLTSVCDIPLKGHVNAIKFASDARFMVAAVGNEHRLGRWEIDKNGKNGIQIIPLAEGLMKKRKKTTMKAVVEEANTQVDVTEEGGDAV